MVVLAKQFPDVDDDKKVILNQLARELMLMQSSDWQFLVTTGQAREYAIQRFSQHVERFDKLASSLDAAMPDVTYAKELYNLDNIFPDIDYRWYLPGEG
jgi:1,4-alpha-glucan branching enzyme